MLGEVHAEALERHPEALDVLLQALGEAWRLARLLCRGGGELRLDSARKGGKALVELAPELLAELCRSCGLRERVDTRLQPLEEGEPLGQSRDRILERSVDLEPVSTSSPVSNRRRLLRPQLLDGRGEVTRCDGVGRQP